MNLNDYNYKVKGDEWYTWKGVTPPERITHLTEEEVQEKLASNLAKHKCQWKQYGGEIRCDVGEYTHGKRIATNLILKGTGSKGEPLLEPIVV